LTGGVAAPAGGQPRDLHTAEPPTPSAPAIPSATAPPPPGPPGPAPVRPAFRPAALAVLAAVAAFGVMLDIASKQLVLSTLEDRAPVRILGGAVYLDVLRNSGAAFSIGDKLTVLFPLITVVVVGWIGWYSRRLRSVPWAVSLGLVLGGALGNLVDRVFRAPGPFVGHVVDFISLFGPNAQYFPVFNAADSALTCGVVLAVLLELTGRRRDGSRVRHSERDQD
jgi:signal peptidase II